MDIAKSNRDVTKPMQSLFPTNPLNWLSPVHAMEDWFDRLESRWMLPRIYGSGVPYLPMEYMNRTPRVDIIDRDKEILVRAELPGIEKNNLAVSMRDDSLTIEASIAEEKKEEEGTYHCCEMVHGKYLRTLQLPMPVDADNAKAIFKNGILELTVPKKEGFNPKKILVE